MAVSQLAVMRRSGVVNFGPSHERAFRRIILPLLAGMVVSWGGVATLITLSILWPGNRVPLIILAAWAGLTVMSVALSGPDEKWPGRLRGWALLLWAPLHPLFRAGLACYAALTAGRK